MAELFCLIQKLLQNLYNQEFSSSLGNAKVSTIKNNMQYSHVLLNSSNVISTLGEHHLHSSQQLYEVCIILKVRN